MKVLSLRMTKISAYLRQLHPLLFIPLIVAVSFVFEIVFYGLVSLFGIPDIVFVKNDIDEYSIFMKIFTAVIMAPLLETLIFQKWFYRLLSKIKYFRNNVCWIIIISGILFGLSHCYSAHYMIITTAIGFLLMYAYILRIDKHPYWTVAAIHALSNFIIFCLDSFLDV